MNDSLHNTGVIETPAHPAIKAPAEPARRGWRQGMPTALVLVLLAAVGWWGHHSGWRVPRFGSLLGGGQDVRDDWCDQHSVPESICVECNAALLPRVPDHGWCTKHGVHNCLFEHPEIAQAKALPKLAAADLERAQRALALKDRPENSSKCKLHQRRLQFASVEVLDKMGVDYNTPVWGGAVEETVQASGEITYSAPRVAPLSSPLAGRILQITEQGRLGAAVQKGDVLALVEAPELGKAKAEFLYAFAQLDLKNKTLENIRTGFSTGAIPLARFMEAETAQREVKIRVIGAQQALINLGLPLQLDEVKTLTPEQLSRHLQFFGIPESVARQLDARMTSANLMPIVAPRAGVVTAVKAVPGEVIESGKTLFVVADTSELWLMLHVRQEDAKYLRIRDPRTLAPGQTVRFRLDGSAAEVAGELVWKSTAVDEKTRTVQCRAEIANPDGRLLANTFGIGRIVLREEKQAVLVPSEAVHWEGDCHVVFVRDKNFLDKNGFKVFHVRTVRPGVKQGRDTEIIAGLLPGEIIAGANSASLRAELLKNRLGEG